MDTFAVTEIPRLLLADLHCGTVIVIYVLLTTDVHLCYTIMATARSNSFCSISELLPINWQILLGIQDNENVDGGFTVKTHILNRMILKRLHDSRFLSLDLPSSVTAVLVTR